jgi:hypothetical protein
MTQTQNDMSWQVPDRCLAKMSSALDLSFPLPTPDSLSLFSILSVHRNVCVWVCVHVLACLFVCMSCCVCVNTMRVVHVCIR